MVSQTACVKTYPVSLLREKRRRRLNPLDEFGCRVGTGGAYGAEGNVVSVEPAKAEPKPKKRRPRAGRPRYCGTGEPERRRTPLLQREARFLRCGVAVASAQPFGTRLKRSQVCLYSSSRLPSTGRGF